MADTLGRAEILRRKREVERVMTSGSKLVSPVLYLRWAPRAEPPVQDNPAQPGNGPACGPLRCAAAVRRVAILVPGRPRGAVLRNRLKRRMREIYRRNKQRFPEGSDYVLQLTARAFQLSFEELRAVTEVLADRLPSNG